MNVSPQLREFATALKERTNPRHAIAIGIVISAIAFVLSLVALAMSACLLFAAPAHAGPGVWPQCVRPDGSPCPPPPPGCVQDNGLPCSGAPQDLNAACAQNPAICMWLTRGGFGL